MADSSPETWKELRRFVRSNAPMEEEPDADDMGGPSDMDADNMPGKGAVAIEVKSEPTGAAHTCPACGQPMP